MSENRLAEIDAFLAAHQCEITQTLKELVAIPSVKGEREPGAPFGTACARALALSAEKLAQLGVETKLFQEGGYALAQFGNGEKTIGLFSHCDVVPAGSGWMYTAPFTPLEKDGFLIGRGAEDNKSGVVASIYALKAIQTLDLPVKSKICVFVGSDEESGMSDVEAFAAEQIMPDVSLVPDNEFPVCVGEKGVLRFFAESKDAFSHVISISGGTAFNVILDRVCITLRNTETLQKELLQLAEQNKKASLDRSEEGLVFTVTGISKHASAPEGSENALLTAAKMLQQCSGLPAGDRNLFAAIAALLQEPYGAVFGIEQEDDHFGRLTCANGIVTLKDGRPALSFDIRYGAETDDGKMLTNIETVLEQMNWAITKIENKRGFDNGGQKAVIQALMDAYGSVSGDVQAKPQYSAGATYASHLKHAFSTGTCAPYRLTPFQDLPEGRGGAHQRDEMLHIDGFIEGIKILICMILSIDRLLNE